MTTTDATGPPRRRVALAGAGIIAASAFGPYVAGGFRTEQIAVYGALLLLLVTPLWLRLGPPLVGAGVAALLVLEFAVAAVGAAWPPQNTTAYQLGASLPGLDNLALPLAVLTIVWILVGSGADRVLMVRRVCQVIVCAMLLNTGLAIAAAVGSTIDLAQFQGQVGASTVAYRAEQLGRFSGIFNQPAEAGLMYSIAALAAIYLYHQRPAVLVGMVALLSVGGLLTVSKVFVLVGLPVVLWQMLRASGRRHRRAAAALTVILAAWAAARAGLTPSWTGADYLLRLLPGSGQNAVDLYTAGRLGGSSTLTAVVSAVLDASPLTGFGAGGLQVPYDNGWVEAFTLAGAVGALAFTATLGTLAWAWWCRRESDGPAASRLAGGIVVVLAAAAVGVPSLTANRCATIVWLLLGLLLLSCRSGHLDSRNGLEADEGPDRDGRRQVGLRGNPPGYRRSGTDQRV